MTTESFVVTSAGNEEEILTSKSVHVSTSKSVEILKPEADQEEKKDSEKEVVAENQVPEAEEIVPAIVVETVTEIEKPFTPDTPPPPPPEEEEEEEAVGAVEDQEVEVAGITSKVKQHIHRRFSRRLSYKP